MRLTALPRNSESVASIASFAGEYSVHLLVKIVCAFTPSRLLSTAFQIAVRTFVQLSAFAMRYPIGWDDFTTKRISSMTKSIPTLAAAFLMTAIATPVFAQAAIQEPGAFAFFHPNADVLNGGRPGYRLFDQSNAYYNSNAYYDGGVIAPEPPVRQRSVAPRHHRTAR
jgi:hypothetical protein